MWVDCNSSFAVIVSSVATSSKCNSNKRTPPRSLDASLFQPCVLHIYKLVSSSVCVEHYDKGSIFQHRWKFGRFYGVTANKSPQKHDWACSIRECGRHVSSLEINPNLFKWRKAVEISIFKLLANYLLFCLFSIMIECLHQCQKVCLKHWLIVSVKSHWWDLSNHFLTTWRAGTLI